MNDVVLYPPCWQENRLLKGDDPLVANAAEAIGAHALKVAVAPKGPGQPQYLTAMPFVQNAVWPFDIDVQSRVAEAAATALLQFGTLMALAGGRKTDPPLGLFEDHLWYAPKEVERILRTSRGTIDRWETSAGFPPPDTPAGKKRGPGIPADRKGSKLNAWCAQQIALAPLGKHVWVPGGGPKGRRSAGA